MNNDKNIFYAGDGVLVQKRGRGRPPGTFKKPQHREIPVIDFSRVEPLKNLEIDDRMLETIESGLKLDALISYEGGMPRATNVMTCGDPGVGKTTVWLDYLAALKLKNPALRCLFISGEMGKKQMYKYRLRFPQFGVVNTMFTSDFGEYCSKDTMEQLITQGWDFILIDSLAEVIDDVREDMEWSRKEAESWLVDICTQNNEGDNDMGLFTSFILIQQVTKGGVFVGSNKLKHLTDASCEMRRHNARDGGGTYIKFTKNRNGNAGDEMPFDIGTKVINYGVIRTVEEIKPSDEGEIPFTIIEPHFEE